MAIMRKILNNSPAATKLPLKIVCRPAVNEPVKIQPTNKSFVKGTKFYVVAESEFIGVKEFVLRTQDLKRRLIIDEDELNKHFLRLYGE